MKQRVAKCNDELHKIPGLSHYLINREGRVYSLFKQGYLRPDIDRDKFLHFKLKNDKKEYKHYYLHRLLALVFIEPLLDDSYIVSFKDRNSSNFSIENLAVYKRRL